jgi:hypothetical protein
MNEDIKARLLTAFNQLDPVNQSDILQFIQARLEARKAGMKPINIEEWDRLPFWVRKLLYWRFHLYVFLNALHNRKKV